MTYTILGYCPRRRSFGIGIATYSLAVGGYCPKLRAGVGAISSQAHANPRLALLGMRLLRRAKRAQEVLDEVQVSDSHFEYRQVGVIDEGGEVAAHTGDHTLAWAGHRLGANFIAMGNGLAGSLTVDAMAEAFGASASDDLAARLMGTLVAGRDAGGQRNSMPARSAALIVYESEEYPLVDLRVDFSREAVDQLGTTLDAYRPYVPLYYDLRVDSPSETPPQEVWLEEQGIEPPEKTLLDEPVLRVRKQ